MQGPRVSAFALVLLEAPVLREPGAGSPSRPAGRVSIVLQRRPRPPQAPGGVGTQVLRQGSTSRPAEFTLSRLFLTPCL